MLDRVTIEHAEAAAGTGPIAIALSGGGDSTALLHLLAGALGALRLRALVVDHALRAGSAEDARRAHGFATALGVAAEVLTIAWPHGAERAQRRAREARYRVLCGAARRLGARVIALGHTADDQAETVLMRAAAGSAWRGLAGMAPIAPAPLWPEGRDIALARPLLAVRRARLRAELEARGAEWIEDPANTDPAYERVRTRARLIELEAAGFDPMRLAGLADALRPRANELDRRASELVAATARFEGEQGYIDRAAWRESAEVRRRALSALIAAASGSAREPSQAGVERLEPRMADSGFRGASLGGAVLEPLGAAVRISRDPGALLGRAGGVRPLPPLALAPGEEAVWDGRLALIAREPGWAVVPAASGPVLQKGTQRLALAETSNAVEACWLLEERVRHLLGQGVNAAKRR